MTEEIHIESIDFWVKVVEFLQQNWALVEPAPGKGANVYFIDDNSGIFDEMKFASFDEAITGLTRNGFKRFSEDASLRTFLSPPLKPFHRRPHPNGPIYSSGRFWN